MLNLFKQTRQIRSLLFLLYKALRPTAPCRRSVLQGLGVSLLALVLLGCGQDNDKHSNTPVSQAVVGEASTQQGWHEPNDTDWSKVVVGRRSGKVIDTSQASMCCQVTDGEQVIDRSITNDYARMASHKKTSCPKLVRTKGQHDISVIRSNEVLTADYCDYFVYLKAGQRINVRTNDARLDASIISPVSHNFGQGSYKIIDAGKYVVRLAYQSRLNQPKRLTYDVTFSID